MIGQTISHYKILEKLGEGGMGVVYRAHDTKLDRDVALKFLPHHIAPTADEQARFLQEARAASALSHPNICTIYYLEDVDDRQFIVMELVDGKTLKQMVPVRKMQTAIDYAIQIGEALQEAHGKGIVHRDVKTDNIMVNSKNQIKVMDFGLAKLKGSLKLTKTTSTVGTLAYMAPEQIRGEPVDGRSDIFSFGVVLFEMLTGHLPFRGEHDAALMYSIVNEEPESLHRYLPEATSELLHIMNRALEKDPEERYQTAHDMLIDLRRLKKETSRLVRRTSVVEGRPDQPLEHEAGVSLPPSFTSQPVSTKRKWIILASSGVIVIALSVIIYLLAARATREGLPLKRTQLTFRGDISHVEISPDGRSIAYVDRSDRVYVQDIAGGKPLEVFKGEVVFDVRWSPSGADLACEALIDSSYHVCVIPRFGGTYRKFRSIGTALSWSPDGYTIAGIHSGRKRIYFVNLSTGADTTRIDLKDGLYWTMDVDWSPAGNVLAVISHDSLGRRQRILTTSQDGKLHAITLEDSLLQYRLRWTSQGDGIYYYRGDPKNPDLMRIDVDPKDGEPRGSPHKVQGGLQLFGISISRDNRRMVGTWGQGWANLWSGTIGGSSIKKIEEEKQITLGTSYIEHARLSPDGKQIVYSKLGSSGNDLFVSPFEGGEAKQLTFGDNVKGMAWSPDGREIAYISSRGGTPKICSISAGGGSPKIISKNAASDNPSLNWAPGHYVLYQLPDNCRIQVLDPRSGEERPLVLNEDLGCVNSFSYSPDGKRIAVEFDHGLWLLSPNDTTKRFLSKMPAEPVGWSTDGGKVLVWDYRKRIVFAVSVVTGKPEILLAFKSEIESFDFNLATNRLVWTVRESAFDAWLLENFDRDFE